MVLPTSVRPARPGDGSGIAERRPTREERHEADMQDAREAQAEALVAEYTERRKYEKFCALFGFERASDPEADGVDD